ncbi:hypothetical protein [Streptomyces rochei]|uniref:hypothetical protein n=1 Tax=Streptomyces rochei TaxID=1928 RepID=UPI0022E9B691|nr:hypothetical protein [Streptomyces rochei]MCC8455602.1 hypothetical protein [Streptomyces rochei]
MDTGDERTTPGGETAPPRVVSQPLPPEVPAPRAEDGETPAPEADADADAEWWRRSAGPLPPEVPAPRAEDDGAASTEPQDGAASDRTWWDGERVRGELRDAWDTHGMESVMAAHEVGAQIGEALAAHLPNPHAAAAKRGLDIRWMRLKYNVPALVITLLTTWGGLSPAERMLRYVTENGALAPLGWLIMAALVIGCLMLTPIGSALGSALAGLVSQLIAGALRAVQRAWKLPVIGYVLKLAAACLAWSFVIALAVLLGRSAIRFLTGV